MYPCESAVPTALYLYYLLLLIVWVFVYMGWRPKCGVKKAGDAT